MPEPVYEGLLSITKVHGDHEVIRINLTQPDHGGRLIQIEVRPEIFVQLLFGQVYGDCTFSTPHLERLGCITESKKIRLYSNTRDPASFAKLAEEHEVDGWRTTEDLHDPRGVFDEKDGRFSKPITLIRYVKPNVARPTTKS